MALAAFGAGLEDVPRPALDVYEPGVRDALAAGLETFDAGLASAEDNVGRAEAWGGLGMLYQAHHLQSLAAACYTNAAALAPEDFRWHYLAGFVQQELGHWDAALRRYDRAAELSSEYPTLFLRRAEARLQLGDLDGAQAGFAAALRQRPDDAAALAGMGRVAVARGDDQAAVRYLGAALQAEPAATRLHHPLGLAFRRTGNVERARYHLERRGRTDVQLADPLLAQVGRLSHSSQIYLEQGYAAVRAGRIEEGVDAFRRAVAVSPDDPAARVSLGQGLTLAGRPAAAVEQFDAALALDPGHGAANYRRGQAFERAGNDDAARAAYARALERDPNYREARLLLADALMRAGSYGDAAAHYSRLAEAPEQRPFFLYRQGLARLAAGDCQQAMRALEAADAAGPGSGEIMLALARAWATCPDAGEERRARALDYAAQLLAARGSADDAETYAMAAAVAGREEEAVDLQSRLVAAAERRGDRAVIERLAANLEAYAAGRGATSAWPADAAVFHPPRLESGPEGGGDR